VRGIEKEKRSIFPVVCGCGAPVSSALELPGEKHRVALSNPVEVKYD
jgi:hypothetical protein